MPRIRTIKPEAPQHRKVGRLSDRAFRLWVVAITQADDEGRLVADPGQLRLLAWGYHDDVSEMDVVAALKELDSWGLLQRYVVDDVPYAHFASWADHQRIHKHHFTPSKLPPPPSQCGMRPVPVPDRSRTSTAGMEGKGREGIGEGREPSIVSLSETTSPDGPSASAPARGDFHKELAAIDSRMSKRLAP